MAAPSASEAAQKYEEAAAAAVEACAEVTKDQTCYICMDGAEEEGLVRACACRGTAGFAHLSCLVQQAQIAVQRGLENQETRLIPRLKWWWTCRLCEQHHHGTVVGALSWACWQTYLGRPEGDNLRDLALQVLAVKMQADPSGRLAILEPLLARLRTESDDPTRFLYTRAQIAKCLALLERNDECLAMRRELYEASEGQHPNIKWSLAIDYGEALTTARDAGAVEFCRDLVARATRELGEESHITERCLMGHARALCVPRRRHALSSASLSEAEAIVAAIARKWRRRLGDSHPNTRIAEAGVGRIRAMILFNGVLAELLAARNCG